MHEESPQGATPFADADSWQWVSRDPAPQDGRFAHQSSLVETIHQHYFLLRGETVWVDDQLPEGAKPSDDRTEEPWEWISPVPLFGGLAHQSTIKDRDHQHFFYDAIKKMQVAPGDSLFAYVYLDPASPPKQVMLQWRVEGSFDHRAYWGENLISWGTDGTPSRRFMGPLPFPGQWVRLEVPARLVELEGCEVNGMAFTLWDGRATWDRAGTSPQGATLKVTKGDLLYADVCLDPHYPPKEIMLQWNDGNWEHRAFWGDDLIPWGGNSGPSHHFVGNRPTAGQWVRLRVPASKVGLEGREVRGMAFTLSNGRATWDRAGVLSGPLMPALFYAPGVL